jgi:hypothetical protein
MWRQVTQDRNPIISSNTTWCKNVLADYQHVDDKSDSFNLIGIYKFKISFKRVDRVIMFTMFGVKVLFFNVNKLVSGVMGLIMAAASEINDIRFLLSMSSVSLNAVVCQFNLGYVLNDACRFFIWAASEENITKSDKAIRYVMRAAKSGHQQAQYVLGCNYEVGNKFLKIYYPKSIHWYTKCAEQQKSLEPFYRLGCLHYHVTHFKKYIKTALYYFNNFYVPYDVI